MGCNFVSRAHFLLCLDGLLVYASGVCRLMSNYDVDLGNAGGDFGVSQPQEPHTNGSGGHNASSSNSSTTNGSGGTGQGHQSSSGSGGVNASGLIEEFTVKFKGPEDSTLCDIYSHLGKILFLTF